jgi:GTP-binding protein
LLHIVDLAPFDADVDPVKQARAIVAELKKYDPKLHAKTRWLVLNKLDMVPAEERDAKVADFVRRFRWKGPVFAISALARDGLQPMVEKIHNHIAALQVTEPLPDLRFDDTAAPVGHG